MNTLATPSPADTAAPRNAQALGAALEFRGIRKSYTGTREARVFDDLSLSVQSGEFIALVGSSGCGKTTLLNMAAGFVMPDAGEVTVDGRAVTGPGRDRGMVFQQYAVFPWLTVRENIAYPMQLKRAERRSEAEIAQQVDHYLRLIGLQDFGDVLPKTLSGGMKQRVAIARAYAANPRVMLMDEPFAALDAQSRERMQDLLLQVTRAESRTVIFVTHSIEEALYLSNRVVVLGGKPSNVVRIFDVALGGERRHSDRLKPHFVEQRGHIEDAIDSVDGGH